MSDLNPVASILNDVEITQDAPISEYLLQKIGSCISEFANGAMPIGTIIPSMLTQAQVDAASYDSGIWLLANGGSCAGSRYALLTGSSVVPDLRGVFLRGKNNGRSDGNQNPAGDSAIGAAQSDEVESHTHNITSYFGQLPRVGIYAPPSVDEMYSARQSEAVTYTSSSSGSELRPRNVTVNFFVRVN